MKFENIPVRPKVGSRFDVGENIRVLVPFPRDDSSGRVDLWLVSSKQCPADRTVDMSYLVGEYVVVESEQDGLGWKAEAVKVDDESVRVCLDRWSTELNNVQVSSMGFDGDRIVFRGPT